MVEPLNKQLNDAIEVFVNDLFDEEFKDKDLTGKDIDDLVDDFISLAGNSFDYPNISYNFSSYLSFRLALQYVVDISTECGMDLDISQLSDQQYIINRYLHHYVDDQKCREKIRQKIYKLKLSQVEDIEVYKQLLLSKIDKLPAELLLRLNEEYDKIISQLSN